MVVIPARMVLHVPMLITAGLTPVSAQVASVETSVRSILIPVSIIPADMEQHASHQRRTARILPVHVMNAIQVLSVN